MPSLILRVISGAHAGTEHQGENDPILIGRDAHCSIVLTDKGVSRQHCRLIVCDGRWMLEDLGSTNGVMLIRNSGKSSSEVRASCVLVQPGDQLGIGEATVSVTFVPEPEVTEILVRNPVSELTAILPRSSADTSKCAVGTDGQDEGGPKESNVGKHDNFPFSEVVDRPHARDLPYRFRKYEVLEKIGEGGMGEVFLASSIDQESADPDLAIKFLHSQRGTSEQDRARFMREMQISVQLKHSSIIECLDCGEEEQQPFIVMPFCSGGNLAELLRRSGILNIRRALRLLDRLLAGVEHAHAAGIVHRDLKPSNILLAKESDRKYIPKVSDFGLAKSYLLAGESGMTVNGTVGGSWGYMPREQLTNFRFVSPQTDVWSLGAILYECLTSQVPRPLQPGVDPIRIVLDSKPVPIQVVMPSIPKRIAQFIMKSLATEIADRYGDAGEMRAALHKAARLEGVKI